jgi:heme/copper-type cytochrome/quinol oxidase subunit 2
VFGFNRRIRATVDFWDDQDDVYAIRLRRNQPVYVGLTGADSSADLSLAFWLPETRSIESVSSIRYRAKISARPGAREYLSFRARSTGTYFVQVRMSSPGLTRYRLTIVKG